MTNEEAIQELFNLESGRYYDTEYVDKECFRIAIKAICNSDSSKAEIYPLKYDNLKLAQENSDLKEKIKSLKNEIDWNIRKFDVEKNELKEAMTQYVEYCSGIIRSASKEITKLLKLNYKVNKRIVKLRAEVKQLKAQLKQSVKLPCKVGDTIYETFDGKINDWVIERISDVVIELKEKEPFMDNRLVSFVSKSFGKFVFLTQEEAEQSLKGQV